MGCSKLSSKREVYSNSLLVQEIRKISKRQYNVIPQRRQWQPTPVLLPGKSHGQRSLVGCSPWGHYDADMTERLHFHALEKEMATHSSILAWRISGTGKPGGLPSMGSHELDMTEVT